MVPEEPRGEDQHAFWLENIIGEGGAGAGVVVSVVVAAAVVVVLLLQLLEEHQHGQLLL